MNRLSRTYEAISKVTPPMMNSKTRSDTHLDISVNLLRSFHYFYVMLDYYACLFRDGVGMGLSQFSLVTPQN